MNAVQALSEHHDPARAVGQLEAERRAGNLVDGFGRRFYYLRLSVTEVCNFRCSYCLPDGFLKTAPLSFLGIEEIARLTRAFALLGHAAATFSFGACSFGAMAGGMMKMKRFATTIVNARK